MKTKIHCAGMLAAATGVLLLAGCDSIKDVSEAPFTDVPDQTAVLGGTIKDLGTLRPLILQYNGQDTCLVPEDPTLPSGPQVVSECRFYGAVNQEYSNFGFGALPVGTAYNITVKKQPFGKICTVAAPNGTVGPDSDELQISCLDDPAVLHYTVTANIDAAASSRAGLKVILTTENGTCSIDAAGQTSVTFSAANCPNSATTGYHQNAHYVFNSQTNLPVFGWRVTATIPGATGIAAPNNCFVTDGPVANTGGNIGDDGKATAAPTGNVTVRVRSCGFTVRAHADYSPASASPPSIAADGVSLLLRAQPSGVDVAAARLTSFSSTFVSFMTMDASGNPTTTPFDAQSNPDAFYEVIVKSSPAGMACVPGSSVTSGSAPQATNSLRTAGHWTDAGAVLLRRPASARVTDLWIVDRVIRCRLLPVEARRLRGVYQQFSKVTTRTTVGSAAPTDAVATTHNHNYLAFFEDGTYLYGNHSSTAANNGVEQGFYDYNPATSNIAFTGFTDTNGNSGLHSSATTGSAAGAPNARNLTGVQRTTAGGRNVISGNFSPISTTSTTTDSSGVTTLVQSITDWVLTAAGPDPAVTTTNLLDGGWVTWDESRQVEDRRRVFVYQHGLYNAFHMGVNGIGNLQEACYVGDFGTTGTWTRQGARSGCNMRVYVERTPPLDYSAACAAAAAPANSCSLLSSGSADMPLPSAALNDFPGRWPQSRNPAYTDGRPYSLVDYQVRVAGTDPSDPVCPDMDKLTVWDTLNGTRKSELTPPVPPIVLCRVTAN